MKIYGIYIGYDYITIASRSGAAQSVAPLIICRLNRNEDRYAQVSKAFGDIIKQKRRLAKKGACAAVLSFESPENVCFTTLASHDIPDITEMMSWEMFIRTGEAVRDYNISSFHTYQDTYFVAGSKIKDIDFYTKQVARLGLKVSAIQPPVAAVLNAFSMNYKAEEQMLIASLSRNQMTFAYLENGKLKHIMENSLHSEQSITSKEIMKARAEISEIHGLTAETPLYITGDLLADKEYGKIIAGDIEECIMLNPFNRVSVPDTDDKELLNKHSFAFCAAVSLSMDKV